MPITWQPMLFKKGVERLLQLAKIRRTAIMCAEAVWWQCHRSLIADYLKAKEISVWHILSKMKVELHPFASAAQIVNGQLSYRAAAVDLELPL
ncbi:MAG: hypothetical protein JWQ71_2001 [Pedosphaera sp.]|nr:hypothetical protein [Pedosphaera sp.]